MGGAGSAYGSRYVTQKQREMYDVLWAEVWSRFGELRGPVRGGGYSGRGAGQFPSSGACAMPADELGPALGVRNTKRPADKVCGALFGLRLMCGRPSC